MYYFGRIIGAFFNQLFRWLFWNKTGQKLLFSILIVFILFCFIKLGEVSAVEEVSDVDYKMYSYYDNLTNHAISVLGKMYLRNPNQQLFQLIKDNTVSYNFYFCYGYNNGSSYLGGIPENTASFNIIPILTSYNFNKTPTSYDYLGITGKTIYNYTFGGGSASYTITNTYSYTTAQITSWYLPLALANYKSDTWLEFEDYVRNGSTEQIISLLEDIKESNDNIEDALTNTETTSETDSFVNVDTSSTDSISSTAVDNVASNVLSNLENKVNNYNPSTDYSFVWNIMNTTITFHSNMIYNLIKDTFLYDLIQMLWYFITGHYCFAFLSNLIHSIKDGSILDGFHPNEVISKEVL